ncbi:MAG: class II fructose-bisphosphate aldolase [Patescibacteria group bacterium]|jgi:fructose-bisphosphate aldolase class II
MQKLSEVFTQAVAERWAIPHFNISDLGMLNAIAVKAAELRAPVMIGVSEGERAVIRDGIAVAMVAAAAKTFGASLYLNADHARSPESAIEAITAGFQSVHIDLSKESDETNIAGVLQVVEAARAAGDVMVEGEIGYLVTDSSTIYTEAVVVPEESLASVERAVNFIQATKVDRLAAAVGTIHGMVVKDNLAKDNVNVERVGLIHSAIPTVPLVLHGGAGVPFDAVAEAVKAGIANVHFSTDLRIAYITALRASLAGAPEEIIPYKLFKPAGSALQEVVRERILLCGAAGKII